MRGRRGKSGLWLVCGALALGLGCVSKSEYRSFVVATRGFVDAVSPVFSDYTVKDAVLSDQSKRNRLGEIADFERALLAAEERVK